MNPKSHFDLNVDKLYQDKCAKCRVTHTYKDHNFIMTDQNVEVYYYFEKKKKQLRFGIQLNHPLFVAHRK